MVSAAEQSGVSETAVVLPKGGGALRGIGETFSADPQSGTYQVAIPVQVPPGRRGATPQLTLSYTSGGGNGPFGLGWAVTVPAITRATRKGIPDYMGSGTFLLDGRDLSCVGPWAEGKGRAERPYRTSGDSTFDKVVQVRVETGEWWERTAADGTVTVFGQTADSRLQDGRDHVFAWLASFTFDPLGNRVHYRYKTDGASRDVYLSRVDYVDVPAGQAATGWLYSVVFDYGEYDETCAETGSWNERPDAFSSFRSGFEIRTARRCRRLFVLLNRAEGSEVVTRYDLDYDIADGNGVSLLRLVTIVGVRDGEEPQKNPPLEFTYSQWQPGPGTVVQIEGSLPGGGLGPGVEVLDGDGLAFPGIVITSAKGHSYLSNDGAGHLQRRDQTGPAGFSLSHSDVWLADMTGDGYADLAYFGDPPGFFAAIPGKGWATRKTELAGGSPINAAMDNGRFADVDGDGRIDVLKARLGAFQVFHNLGPAAGWGQPNEAPIPRSAGQVRFGDPLTMLADLSGDGPIDLVRVTPLIHAPEGYSCRFLQYWPHFGHGRFAADARNLLLPLVRDGAGTAGDPFAHGLDPRRLKLVDVDGDGYADVVYVGHEDVIVWLNQAGNLLSAPVRVPLSPAGPSDSQLQSLRVVDWYGHGVAGLLWSTGTSPSPLRHVYLNSGVKPYLLTGIDNHRGATAAIGYRSSASYAREDEQNGQPWRTQLPFPVHVVGQVVLTDVFSGSRTTTTFTYHEGVWDGLEREFRGFARVEQDDAETVAAAPAGTGHRVSPPVRTITWFHVGAVGVAGEAGEPDLAAGYWQTPAGERGPREAGPLVLPSATAWNWDQQPAAVRRRALRALRGRPARVEQYLASDAGSADRRPYAVTEYGYELRAEYDGRDDSDPSWQADPVIAALARGTRTSQWERGHDPMTRASYELRHDEYGRPRLLADIAVPRGRHPYRPGPAAEPYLVEVTERRYATQGPGEPGHLLDRVASEVHYEITDQAAGTVPDLVDQVEAGKEMPRRVIAATATYYDGPEYQGLQLGRLGRHGLVTRVEKLAHTPQTLAAIFDGQTVPPWLADPGTAGAETWPGFYPAEYHAAITRSGPSGGYSRHIGADVPDGLYITEAARRYDVHDSGGNGDGSGRGLLRGFRDACGVTVTFKPDHYDLRPASVTTGDRLEEQAEYDYRTQLPTRVVDANGYQTRYTYTPLGLLHTVIRTGPDGEPLGDTDAQPGVTYTYGLTEYDDSARDPDRRPVWVHALTRLVDRWATLRQEQESCAALGLPAPGEADVFPADERVSYPERFAEQRDYSDGFGRLLQDRAYKSSPVVAYQSSTAMPDLGLLGDSTAVLAPPRLHPAGDPGNPLVRVTGWVAYDNKGRVVEQYEPFFAQGWAYQDQDQLRAESPLHGPLNGQITQRDPRGLAVTIINPDGTQRRFVHGRPNALTQPDQYEPSAWEFYEYDADDNAVRTHPQADPSWLVHTDTPASVEADPRGRIITVTERDGAAQYNTQVSWDITGNVTQVTDALGRPDCYRAVYDLLGRPWRETTLDSGTTITIRDPLGTPIETRDARGALTLDAYDPLHRLSRRWACPSSRVPLLLQEAVVYGDDPGVPNGAIQNLRGRAWRRYDPIGVTVHEQYDAHNNLQTQTRRWLPTSRITQSVTKLPSGLTWPPPNPGIAQLEDGILGDLRVTIHQLRDRTGTIHAVGVTGPSVPDRTVTYTRDSTDEVTAITVRTSQEQPLLNQRIVDARAQEVLLERDGRISTRLLRDPRNSMLLRQRTERSGDEQPVIHDVQLGHGPTGVILSLKEWSPRRLKALTSRFEYDALHRLRIATGPVCARSGQDPWAVTGDSADEGYCQYQYDAVGNLLAQRCECSGHIQQRNMELQPGTNRLAALHLQEDDGKPRHITYTTDPAGDVTAEGPARTFTWDHRSRLSAVQAGISSHEPVTANWYDSDQRICTVLSSSKGPTIVTHYVGDWVTCRLTGEGDAGAALEVIITITTDGTPTGDLLAWHMATPTQKQCKYLHALPDYLGSVRAVIRSDGTPVQLTDYTPYGEVRSRQDPSPGTQLPRTLGYGRGEEDSATGLVLLGRRPYAPWLGRFLSVDTLEDLRSLAVKSLIEISDPADPPTHRIPAWALSPYMYAANSPLTILDNQGRQPRVADGCQPRVQMSPSPRILPTFQPRQRPSVTPEGLEATGKAIKWGYDAKEFLKDPKRYPVARMERIRKFGRMDPKTVDSEYQNIIKEDKKTEPKVEGLMGAIKRLWKEVTEALGGAEKPRSNLRREQPSDEKREPNSRDPHGKQKLKWYEP